MKKSTLEAIRNYLNGDDTVDLSVVREEVNTEWDKLYAKNKTDYNSAREVAFHLMSETVPQTVKEIFAQGEGLWPDGFKVGQLQYAFLNYWTDSVMKHENGKAPFTYTTK